MLTAQYRQYEHIILDSTIFRAPLPDDFVEFLPGRHLIIANTYKNDLDAFRATMHASQAEILNKNLHILQEARLTPFHFNSAEYEHNGVLHDIEGLIYMMTGCVPYRRATGVKCLVMTADETLIRKLIQKKIPVDIVNCAANDFLPHSEFNILATTLPTPRPDANDPLPTAPKAKNGTLLLYTDGGQPVYLGLSTTEADAVLKGRESQVYDRCHIKGQADMDLFGKVFNEPGRNNEYYLTKGKVENIRKLRSLYQTMQISWATLPVALLYQDQACTMPVGYLMRKAPHQWTLQRICRFHNNWEIYNKKPLSLPLQLALQLTRQVMYLNVWGIWPVDYTFQNFGHPENEEDLLYMWDTDSFSQPEYCSLTHPADLFKKPGPHPDHMELCADLLYQRVFSILTLGTAPFDANAFRKEFLFESLRYPFRYRGFYIPENLRKLFHQVFVCGCAPSVRCLMQELALALELDRLNPQDLYQIDSRACLLDDEGVPFYQERRHIHPVLRAPVLSTDLPDRNQAAHPRRAGTAFRRVVF